MRQFLKGLKTFFLSVALPISLHFPGEQRSAKFSEIEKKNCQYSQVERSVWPGTVLTVSLVIIVKSSQIRQIWKGLEPGSPSAALVVLLHHPIPSMNFLVIPRLNNHTRNKLVMQSKIFLAGFNELVGKNTNGSKAISMELLAWFTKAAQFSAGSWSWLKSRLSQIDRSERDEIPVKYSWWTKPLPSHRLHFRGESVWV